MSNYDAKELSVASGSPVEAYRFQGTFKTYRYTSADTAVVVAGETFDPVVIKRQASPVGTNEEDQAALDVLMPIDLQLVKDYPFGLTPPPSLLLEVLRYHRGTDPSVDWRTLWKGKVTLFDVEGRWAAARIPSTFARALQGDVPNVFYQNVCNHVLFDGRCRADRATNSTITTVVSVSGTSVQVANDGFADAFLRAGEIVAQRSHERRLIIDNQVNLITINYQFADLVVGDTVELTAGCNHQFSTCVSKFANGANYGGHPYIPEDNPFIGEL